MTVFVAPDPTLLTVPPTGVLEPPSAPATPFVVCCTVDPSWLPVPDTTFPSVFAAWESVCCTCRTGVGEGEGVGDAGVPHPLVHVEAPAVLTGTDALTGVPIA